MFESIISTSFYGSATPYVRGRLEKIDDETVAFIVDTKQLNGEEKTKLTEIIKEIQEIKERLIEFNGAVVTVLTNNVVFDFNDSQEAKFILKGIYIDNNKIAQANARMGGIVHFQVKDEEEDVHYTKFDAKVDELAIILMRILSLYEEAHIKAQGEDKETNITLQ